MSLNMLRTVGNQLDYCLVMSYDAGNLTTTGYNPKVGWGGGEDVCTSASLTHWRVHESCCRPSTSSLPASRMISYHHILMCCPAVCLGCTAGGCGCVLQLLPLQSSAGGGASAARGAPAAADCWQCQRPPPLLLLLLLLLLPLLFLMPTAPLAVPRPPLLLLLPACHPCRQTVPLLLRITTSKDKLCLMLMLMLMPPLLTAARTRAGMGRRDNYCAPG
jgi:hypothetical protein